MGKSFYEIALTIQPTFKNTLCGGSRHEVGGSIDVGWGPFLWINIVWDQPFPTAVWLSNGTFAYDPEF